MMPSEGNKILEFNQIQKCYKAPFIICAIFECFIEKIYVNRILKTIYYHHEVSQCLQYRHLKA